MVGLGGYGSSVYMAVGRDAEITPRKAEAFLDLIAAALQHFLG